MDLNAHFLFPLRAYPRFTPYILGGLGILRGGSNTDAGLNLGGGARWSVGKDWGLRPEIKFLIKDNTQHSRQHRHLQRLSKPIAVSSRRMAPLGLSGVSIYGALHRR
ncbi:MAG: hypothetical protein WDO18_15600 [Acidobacteriota bacterium]